MEPQRLQALRQSYDVVTDEYVARIYDELRHKPFDREVLARLHQRVGGLGPICDLGCGPGQVARYLRERGAECCGLDLSPAMIEAASRLNPGIPFSVGDMLALPIADESWGGIAAFYSLVHIPRPDLPQAIAEMRRALRPGGFLLAAFHIGEETLHLDEWWGRAVSLDFHFFRTAELQGHLTAAGLEIVEANERDPYPEVEHASRRAYILAAKA